MVWLRIYGSQHWKLEWGEASHSRLLISGLIAGPEPANIHTMSGHSGGKVDVRLTPPNIYEMVAEVGFKKYFHLGGFDASQA